MYIVFAVNDVETTPFRQNACVMAIGKTRATEEKSRELQTV